MLPFDYIRCQSLVPNGRSFMTLSEEPRMIRCKRETTFVLIYKTPDKHGHTSSMGLCRICKDALEIQLAEEDMSFTEIERTIGG